MAKPRKHNLSLGDASWQDCTGPEQTLPAPQTGFGARIVHLFFEAWQTRGRTCGDTPPHKKMLPQGVCEPRGLERTVVTSSSVRIPQLAGSGSTDSTAGQPVSHGVLLASLRCSMRCFLDIKGESRLFDKRWMSFRSSLEAHVQLTMLGWNWLVCGGNMLSPT